MYMPIFMLVNFEMSSCIFLIHCNASRVATRGRGCIIIAPWNTPHLGELHT